MPWIGDSFDERGFLRRQYARTFRTNGINQTPDLGGMIPIAGNNTNSKKVFENLSS
jgi:hypothetical protein